MLITTLPCLAFSLVFDLPRNGDNVVGEVITTRARDGEKITDVGRRFDIGYWEMVEANPDWTFHEFIPQGTRIIVPAKFVLPRAPRQGIVINLAELRLYYYPKGTRKVVTLPVGIGREGWATPLGATYVASKVKGPSWHPTKKVRDDAKKHGILLPKYWPPGPDNPLGQFAMRLGWNTYLIHGTNDPTGVGRRSSAGCIRMYPEDIEELYAQVPAGTPVRVVNQPNKVGKRLGRLYLESHKPLRDKGKYVRSNTQDLYDQLNQIARNSKSSLNWHRIESTLHAENGLPTVFAHNKFEGQQSYSGSGLIEISYTE